MSKQTATDDGSMSQARTRRSIAQELRNLILLAVLPFVVLIGLLAYLGYQDARSNAEAFVLRQAARVAFDTAEFIRESVRG